MKFSYRVLHMNFCIVSFEFIRDKYVFIGVLGSGPYQFQCRNRDEFRTPSKPTYRSKKIYSSALEAAKARHEYIQEGYAGASPTSDPMFMPSFNDGYNSSSSANE